MENYTTAANRQIYKLIAELPAMMAAATTLDEKMRVGELAVKLKASVPKKKRHGKKAKGYERVPDRVCD